MRVIIDNMMRLVGLPEQLEQALREKYTWKNPVYWTARKNRRPCAHLPKELVLWRKEGDEFVLPRGTWAQVVPWLEKQGVDIEHLRDQRVAPDLAEPFRFSGTLRDYQQAAVDAAINAGQGVIQAPTGSGKTVIAMGLVARARVPTLFIVHTSLLVEQTAQRAADYLGIRPHITAAGKLDIGPLTVGLVQTLTRRDLSQISGRFGMVILDEAHHCPAVSFQRVIQEFPARYRFGLTATPERKDKLHPLLYAVIGPRVFDVSNAALLARGSILRPDLITVETAFRFRYRRDAFQEMLQAMTRDQARNELIVKVVKNMHKRSSLVLSERVAHCKLLARKLADAGLAVAAITGDMGADERNRVMENFGTGQIQILVATTNLVGEGFDLPQIDTLFLTMPNSNRAKTLQLLGRVLRPSAGKRVGRIVDFWDKRVPILNRQFQKRRDIYLNFGND